MVGSRCSKDSGGYPGESKHCCYWMHTGQTCTCRSGDSLCHVWRSSSPPNPDMKASEDSNMTTSPSLTTGLRCVHGLPKRSRLGAAAHLLAHQPSSQAMHVALLMTLLVKLYGQKVQDCHPATCLSTTDANAVCSPARRCARPCCATQFRVWGLEFSPFSSPLNPKPLCAVLRGAVPDAVPGHAAQCGERVRASTCGCGAASAGGAPAAPPQSLPEG